MKSDYHIHTSLCKHAGGEMHEYVEKAISAGLQEIAFTDHIPLPDGFDLAHRMDLHELDKYVQAVTQLQGEYPQIKILLGIEADFYDGYEEFLYQTLQKFDFDLAILSVHFIRHWPDGNWVFNYHFPDRHISEIYSDYLKAILRGINTGMFNIIGHLDMIKSKGMPLLQYNFDQVVTLIRAARDQGMAVELNTSGLRKEIGETFPHLDILPLLDTEKLAVTFGSDAHMPDQVGLYFEELANRLASYPGIKIARFRQRKPILFDQPIPQNTI